DPSGRGEQGFRCCSDKGKRFVSSFTSCRQNTMKDPLRKIRKRSGADLAVTIQSVYHSAFREKRVERLKDGRIVLIRPAKSADAAEIARRMALVVKEGIYLEEESGTLPTSRDKEREIRKVRDEGGLYAVAEIEG